MTLNAIIKEIKNIPVNRLEELYQLIHSMTPVSGHNESLRKKILSFGGSFSDLSNEDYSEFLDQTTKTRIELFNRDAEV
jgi:hypothetical protein